VGIVLALGTGTVANAGLIRLYSHYRFHSSVQSRVQAIRAQKASSSVGSAPTHVARLYERTDGLRAEPVPVGDGIVAQKQATMPGRRRNDGQELPSTL
jgi:hypothetical protein